LIRFRHLATFDEILVIGEPHNQVMVGIPEMSGIDKFGTHRIRFGRAIRIYETTTNEIGNGTGRQFDNIDLVFSGSSFVDHSVIDAG
jgi:hypothetical protein